MVYGLFDGIVLRYNCVLVYRFYLRDLLMCFIFCYFLLLFIIVPYLVKSGHLYINNYII